MDGEAASGSLRDQGKPKPNVAGEGGEQVEVVEDDIDIVECGYEHQDNYYCFDKSTNGIQLH